MNGLNECTCSEHTGKDFRDIIDLRTGESILPKDDSFADDEVTESNECLIPSA